MSRLNTLTDAAASLTHNNNHDLNPIGSDEIGRLMGVFNNMKRAIKNREDKLTQQRDDINQLTRIVTHDMKPPIINIKGHAKIIAEAGETLISKTELYKKESAHFTTIEKSIAYINKSVIRVDELINGVLKHSTLSDRKLNNENINIKEIIEQVLDLNSARLKNVNIKTFEQTLNVISDAFVLKFNFSTLIDNAINYQDQSRPLEIIISFLEDAEFYTISICDNGIGMSEHQQSNLFQLSNKSSKDGSFGVGLASARMLMRRIRGDLTYSVPDSNVGSIFSVRVFKGRELQ